MWKNNHYLRHGLGNGMHKGEGEGGVRKVGGNQGEQDDPEAKSSWRAKLKT